jgi:hypothetical protein
MFWLTEEGLNYLVEYYLLYVLTATNELLLPLPEIFRLVFFLLDTMNIDELFLFGFIFIFAINLVVMIYSSYSSPYDLSSPFWLLAIITDEDSSNDVYYYFYLDACYF